MLPVSLSEAASLPLLQEVPVCRGTFSNSLSPPGPPEHMLRQVLMELASAGQEGATGPPGRDETPGSVQGPWMVSPETLKTQNSHLSNETQAPSLPAHIRTQVRGRLTGHELSNSG